MDALGAEKKEVGSPNTELKPKKLTAFDLVQNFCMCAHLARINGVLHGLDMSIHQYVPLEKEDIVKIMLSAYYNELSESGSLRLAKEGAEILWHMEFANISTTNTSILLNINLV